MATETLLNSFPKKNNAMTTTPLRIAVLGIGMMGLPMARRLSEAGHQVHAWNRTRAKAEPLTQWGVTVHSSPADAVKDADVAISLLENGPVVGQVLFEQRTAQAMRPGALFIDMASIQPSEARDHAARLGELGVAHLDAPVSGGTVGAEAGTLAGFDLAGYCTQAAFLLGNGIDVRLAEAEAHARDEAGRLRLRHETRQLTVPDAMGERFQFIGFQRDVEFEHAFIAGDMSWRL